MVKYLEDCETSDVQSKQAEFSVSDWLTTENCGLATVSVSCSWYDLEPSDVRSKQLEFADSD